MTAGGPSRLKASPELRAAIVLAFQTHHPKFVQMAEDVVREIPSMKGLFSGGDLDQLVNGFAALVSEALDGTSEAVWELFIGSVGEGFAASSQLPEDVAAAVTTWATSLSLALSRELPSHLQAEASRWLPAFFGAYSYAMIAALLAPSRARAGTSG